MKLCHTVVLPCFLVLFIVMGCQKEKKLDALSLVEAPAQYVNPFIGTGGHGHTFPGATVPFGMVQLSPDTRLTGWDGCSGYHYTDNVIYGFSHTHLSGTGVSDYGDILFMPTIGPLHYNNGEDGKTGYSSKFRKENEIAEAGYYKVKLEDYGIEVELTATERVGVHKYNLPAKDTAHIIVDLDHRDKWLSTGFEEINNQEVAGFRISDAWATEQHVYFVAKFSRPFTKVLSDTTGGQRNYALQFPPSRQPLIVKVGISPVNIAGAKKNLEAEIPEWDFEAIRTAAKAKWDKQLSKIQISSKNEDLKKIFYTGLYHTTIVPNLFSDVDGRYRGMDMKLYGEKDYDRYTVFSLWDTYRATHPLFTLIEQDRTNDFIKTFLAQFEEGGKLPMWELACNYTGCMIGYHSVPVIADAYVKGIRDYDADLALRAMTAVADREELGSPYFREMGFIPTEKEHESVSKTLEYAYDDWTIAQMAKAMKQQEVYEEYIRRAQYYKNLFDPQSHMMRGKTDHRWWKPFTPEEVNFNYTEANAWQYSFYVPQDIDGLIKLHGGKDSLEAKLDQLFSVNSETYGRDLKDISGLIGQYAHGNEPSHHMAFLYNYLDKPWKSQKMVREILQGLYKNAPDGLSGNEDCGQMSAWYVLSAIGIYAVAPGSPQYALTSPIIEEAKMQLENGKSFTIKVKNQAPDHHYIQSASLNGKNYTKSYIMHEDIMEGGILEFELGPRPNTSWGVGNRNRPKTSINDELIMPVPAIAKGKRTFSKVDTIELNCPVPNAQIFYTLDGTPAELDANGRFLNQTEKYNGTIYIDTTTILRAIAWHPEIGKSKEIQATFFAIPQDRSLELTYPYADYYAAGGSLALIDHIVGAPDFRTGEWQGYHGVNLEATVDLENIQYINNITINFLQDQNSWIFMPTSVTFEVSSDGEMFTQIAQQKPQTTPQAEGSIIESFSVQVESEVRFIRVKGINQGVCPDWHKGAGNKAWVFADEIIINQE